MTTAKKVAKTSQSPKAAIKKKSTPRSTAVKPKSSQIASRKAAKEIREILTIEELVKLVVMSPIEFFELSAVQNEATEENDKPEIEPVFKLKIGHPSDGIAIRLAVEIVTEKGSIKADAGVIYTTSDKGTIAPISEPLGLEFANRVAIFAIVPYLREAVSNVSARVLGKQVTLPMLLSGELVFSTKDSVGN